MASIKVKFRPSAIPGCEGTIYYQIIHARKVRQILSDHKVLPTEWDAKRSTVTAPRRSGRCGVINAIRESIRIDLDRLSRIERRLDATLPDYTAEDIVEEYHRYSQQYTLFRFIESNINYLRSCGRIRTSETYQAALNSFRKFRCDKDLMIDLISPAMIEDYQNWLRMRNVTPNTSSFYNRILRAVYNRAVLDDIVTDRSPFRRVYTGVDKTVRRALPLKAIRKIRNLDLSQYPSLDFARDMFVLSFMLRGMSFVDMAYLKKTDCNDSRILYRRRKTGQLLSVAWTSDMQAILSKYPENESDYLLPIIRANECDDRRIYLRTAAKINRHLKTIARMIRISVPLTLYVARHSWASAARYKGIPMSVISEGMGHDRETTTRIYLASLDTAVIDRANNVILKALR